MPSDIIEPQVADNSGANPEAPPLPRPPAQPALSSSTSGDDLSASLVHARPDPLLGSFDSGSAHDVEPPTLPDLEEMSASEPPVLLPQENLPARAPDLGNARGSEISNALQGLQLDEADVVAAPPLPNLSFSSAESLPTLNFGPSPTYATTPPSHPSELEVEDQDDDDSPARGRSWPTLLLASYASAVTLGLLWVLLSGRRIRESPEPDTMPPADSRADPGLRAESSRRLFASPPIAVEHLTTLGKMVRLGMIEATPLELSSTSIRLRRTVKDRVIKPAGDNALQLRLKLRNVSSDTLLAPFDEAFIRNRVRAEPDSFIEPGDGSPNITMFPLAVESEWELVGQAFQELKPGEEFETIVVSVPDAVPLKSDEYTWRIRLRTDLNHTDDLGVQFQASDVKPSP